MNFKPPTTSCQLPTGFTLIESLVAVTIMTLAIVGPMYAASRAIVAAQLSRDQLTASYLAQEGIEFVRAIRDDKYLILHPGDTSNAWADFLTAMNNCDATNNPTQACTLDPFSSSPQLVPCSNAIPGTCTPLRLSQGNAGSRYRQGNPPPFTQFTRTVQRIDRTPGVQVTSEVKWSFHGATYSVTISDHLTPWQ